MKNIQSVSWMLGLIITVLCLSSFADSVNWKRLGSRTVTFKSDHDEILVTGREGTFKAVKLLVEKADIHIDRIIIHYRMGQPEILQVRNRIPAGGETRVLDLKGNNRIIRKVVFYYSTPVKEVRKAKVILYGIQ